MRQQVLKYINRLRTRVKVDDFKCRYWYKLAVHIDIAKI